ncbi:MAG: acyl-CoA dehydrogenase [Actinobacteria bacterium]|nr:acyl-CoA dehydrogenase [Actinomycetota bacterium]
MDFSHSARSDRLLDQLCDFVETSVTPAVEIVAGERADNPGVPPVTTERLIAEAKNAGLWNLCVRPPDYGPGLLFTEYAQLAEFMGPHPLAQEVTNCDAPSNINGDAMIAYGSPEQKGRWVEPQLDGQIKSAFAMTEPAVASSDAANLATTAVKDGDHWILNGRKWYVSGVLHPKCAYMMTVANTADGGPPHGRHTQFILPVDTAGVTVEDVRVPDANVLGEVGGGFAIGQARLGPARVQHCMRIIGIAEEALRLMCERAPTRSTFGAAVSTRSNVMDWIGEARIEIEAARGMVLRAAWLMDTQGDKASAPHMSQIKVQVVRSATTVVDRAIQVFGAAGVSEDTPLARWYAMLRSLRIADGPDEVHLMGIARRELRRHA